MGMAGMLTAPVVSAAYLVGMVLLFVELNAPSSTTTVIAPFFILFTAGGMIRLGEAQLDLFKCGVLACAALVLTFLPISGDIFESARGSIVFAHGPGITWQLMRWYVTLLALPFALLFLARRFPVSLQIHADYSYGIYIFAWPIQQTLVFQAARFDIALGPRTLFVVSAILSFGCAFVSWHLVEKNALRLSRTKVSFTAFRKRLRAVIRLARQWGTDFPTALSTINGLQPLKLGKILRPFSRSSKLMAPDLPRNRFGRLADDISPRLRGE
jgi:peptidoglycan/LPS O-acetylase OafA/YrhL